VEFSGSQFIFQSSQEKFSVLFIVFFEILFQASQEKISSKISHLSFSKIKFTPEFFKDPK
jgi:hypothetical protein